MIWHVPRPDLFVDRTVASKDEPPLNAHLIPCELGAPISPDKRRTERFFLWHGAYSSHRDHRVQTIAIGSSRAS
jgi:hypothetical protein